ncbi:MAG TPA: HAMP domain-containing sensor histidine kinase, partial [Vicinamibacterales bacterium]
NFTVTTRIEPGATVWADAEAVEQAFENLLSNAMKYSPERREIEVETGQVESYGYLRVRDHGVGIPPKFQRKIFRKFYRVEPDDGNGPQGCGLGLAIVDYVVRAHGGRVDVESELGQGSTFTIKLPIVESPAGAGPWTSAAPSERTSV